MRGALGKRIPQRILNGVLLSFPFLYSTKLVSYESYLSGSLRLIEDCIEKTDMVPGDVIECGCARCGTTAVMAKKLLSLKSQKVVYGLDSFGEGFDKADLEREQWQGARVHDVFHYNSLDYATRKIESLGISKKAILIKGFFNFTLPTLSGPFSFALIDCDLGVTVSFCLEELFPKISPKGMIFVDEYGDDAWSGVKPAVDEFLLKHATEVEKTVLGYHILLRKSVS